MHTPMGHTYADEWIYSQGQLIDELKAKVKSLETELKEKSDTIRHKIS